MYDICCIGHITLDKVITPGRVVEMAGGTSFYFSNAIHRMGVQFHLLTSLAVSETRFLETLRSRGITVTNLPSSHTVNFVNIYPENQDHREQKVLQKADPFPEGIAMQADSHMVHLGPLLADDMPVSLISHLAQTAKVSLDAQGFLREVRGQEVFPVDWLDKKQALPYVHTLKTNETEMEMLTGTSSIKEGAETLAKWGVKEVVITLGSKGSVIYADGIFYSIPAFRPSAVTDATGCGDTYMAGYLSQRAKGRSIQASGEFAAAVATIKIQSSGPFTGSESDVLQLLQRVKVDH